MSYRSLSFIPSFHHDSVFSNRFNQIDKMFSTLTGEKPISDTPLYNLCQISETQYKLSISIPGYKESELDISVHNNELLITGKKEKQKKEKEELIKWLHKSITISDFSLQFKLNHKIKVQRAELSLGILVLNFECQIPEEEKPKKILISTEKNNKIIEKK
ncbi:Hsp20 family protein [Buchnera aphidicola (Muscaphis stroyani)]|uniref:Hsp20 family protein n=1 Tax=Buchnera aphidicola (Muscaphis stroyani) TaxID=1241869 RepID=A0A4D6Y607_9GAMM|nr:Hsp20 family protein [Buchnera aphidicola]QCI24609.1 Hsp20 family protein [Buchnera aphidicola (Muscaphis stroyani)]